MSRSPTLPPEHQHYNTIITRSGEHLLTLINDILDMSKIEAGQVTLNPKIIDLHYLIAQVEDMFRLRAGSKGLYLHIEAAPEIPAQIQTDESKLRQVLINLVGNAIKFTEQGGVTLRVRNGVASEGDISSLIHFEVKDTGPGVAPEEIETIFEAFGQTELGRQVEQGAGLGLSISHKFVQLLGGNLQVESTLGEGAIFKFTIPVQAIDAIEIEAPRIGAKTLKGKIQSRVVTMEPGQPHFRILVVDDNLENRQLLVELLKPLGFELREAANGQEAVDIWAEWQPQLIWMDVRMPVMNGYAATQSIRSMPQGQQPVIIAITASAFEEEQAVALATGCNDFLRKPFRDTDIFELLHHHLGVRLIEEAVPDHLNIRTKAKIDWTDLPQALLMELEQAALRIDVEKVENLIETVRTYDDALAGQLSELAQDFQYDKIIALLHRSLK
jgi:CheY-like chemotaxis protein